MDLNLERVAKNVRRAETEDLLDRATVYRDGMEPGALELIDAELERRGLTPWEVSQHEERRRETMIELADGTAMRCSFCDRPAVSRGWGWHRLWGLVPVFPRLFARCADHNG
jgi:hypothetical protein